MPSATVLTVMLIVLVQLSLVAAPIGNRILQLYNQDPQTFVLGWRGILALHAVAIDTWFLAGFAVTRLPFSFRMHWATEPLWIFVSYACISTGMTELLGVAEWWIGPMSSRPEPVVSYAVGTSAAFGALTTVHLITMAFAPNNQRRRLCCLGVAISGLTVLAHNSSHLTSTALITGTYGAALAPLRYVLWAHTSPALGLIIAGPSELPACETHLRLTRLVISIMLSGMLATVRPPPLPPALAGPWAVAAFLYAWRGGWLVASCLAMCVALRRMCRLIFKQVAPRATAASNI